MKRLAMWVGALALLCGGCDASTDEQCDDACEEFSQCEEGAGYGQRGYDECVDECKDEGDWDDIYVDCVNSYIWCNDMHERC